MAVAGAVALLFTACGGGQATTPSAPLKIGLIASLSGPLGLYGPSVVDAAKLGVSQINSQGGVLGRQLVLDVADDASDPKTGSVAAEKLITEDKVDWLVSTSNSAVRDAFTPAVQKAGIPFIYGVLYEGGFCLKNGFVVAEVPPQYNPMYPYVMSTTAKKNWYLLGHDYVWPQKTNPQAKQAIQAAGGKVVGQELVPFGTSDFSSTINKIKQSGADLLLITLVGADFGTFLKQWRSFGLDKTTTMVTLTMTDDFAAALGSGAAGVYSVFAYFQNLSTPANQAYIAAYRQMFGPSAPAQTTLSEGAYEAVNVLAMAAKKSGSASSDKVVGALAGIQFQDAPRGPITIDATTHHAAEHMYLIQAGSDGQFSLVKDLGQVPPGPQCSL